MAIRSGSKAQAFFRIPEGVTDTFRQKILELRPSVKTDYLKQEFFSKFVSADTDSADLRRGRAIAKWLAQEQVNEATNTRLLTLHDGYQILPHVTWSRFRSFCQSTIQSILGDVPTVDALIGSFSGGASTSRPRTQSYPSSKYLGKAHVTSDCLALFTDLCGEMPGWLGVADFRPTIVRGNVMFTVPKKTDIDRVACKEPDINMFLQKGLGGFIRKGLRKAGINLNDQSINRSFAREGAITGDLATMDLSSASDSVTTVLVSEFLPVCWYTTLDSVRSRVTIIDGVEHRNEMFSSMGNGFTFELESLLFFAIAKAVTYFTGTRGVVSVYGDDLIIPSSSFDDLEWVLGVLGFRCNRSKSFSDGPFRESCGGHYHDGLDITPFYVKGPLENVVDVIHAANSLREWALIPEFGILNPEVEDIWLWLKAMVPKQFWGGGDTSYKYQLVSLDAPNKRIYEETLTHATGLGGYFHWLNTTWDRDQTTEGVKTSSRTENLKNKFRSRPVRDCAVPRLPALFLSELS